MCASICKCVRGVRETEPITSPTHDKLGNCKTDEAASGRSAPLAGRESTPSPPKGHKNEGAIVQKWWSKGTLMCNNHVLCCAIETNYFLMLMLARCRINHSQLLIRFFLITGTYLSTYLYRIALGFQYNN